MTWLATTAEASAPCVTCRVTSGTLRWQRSGTWRGLGLELGPSQLEKLRRLRAVFVPFLGG